MPLMRQACGMSFWSGHDPFEVADRVIGTRERLTCKCGNDAISVHSYTGPMCEDCLVAFFADVRAGRFRPHGAMDGMIAFRQRDDVWARARQDWTDATVVAARRSLRPRPGGT